MARIRTIKPEFPQSESIGRLSRDSRLLFILLWTIADDSGRLRGASRMLASLLYPYDDDAPRLIEGWLAELEAEKCIARYSVEGQTYIQILNWLKHQKIDKPSASRFPAFDEGSRILSKPREVSSGDLGPRIKDQGPRTSTKSGLTSAVAGIPRLYDIIKDSFLSITPTFTNWAKEGAAIKRIIGYLTAHAPGMETELAEAVIVTFKALIDSGDRFWSGQPFTPSALSSSGIFDRVLAEAKKKHRGMSVAAEMEGLEL